MEFKDRLIIAMERKNIRPSELSRITGIGEGAISQYRKGAYKATQRNLEKIATALDVSIPWLMGMDCTPDVLQPVSSGFEVTPEEIELLKLFRTAPPEKQAAIRALLK